MANYLQRVITAGARIQSSAKPPVQVPAIVPSPAVISSHLAPPPMPSAECAAGRSGRRDSERNSSPLAAPVPVAAELPETAEPAVRQERTVPTATAIPVDQSFGAGGTFRQAPGSTAGSFVCRNCADDVPGLVSRLRRGFARRRPCRCRCRRRRPRTCQVSKRRISWRR